MVIRQLNGKDLASIHKFLSNLSDSTILRYGRWSVEEVRYLTAERDAVKAIAEGREVWFGTFNNDQLFGVVHFRFETNWSRKGYVANYGICISDGSQGKGLGKELSEHGLEEMRRRGFGRIWLTVDADNFRARKLYEKLGFKQEGTFIRNKCVNGEFKDEIFMAVFL